MNLIDDWELGNSLLGGIRKETLLSEIDMEGRGINIGVFVHGKKLNSTLNMEIMDESTIQRHFTISGFLGNCSSLILAGIQNGDLSNHGRDVIFRKVSVALHFGKLLGYKFLFLSVSNSGYIEFIKDVLGFTSLCEGRNPHSGNINMFFCMDIESERALELINRHKKKEE